MATAWYIVPYELDTSTRFPAARRCPMDAFTSAVTADGGVWREIEVLGGYAIVKVRAALTTLVSIDAAAGFMRLPKDDLTSPLSDLTTLQKSRLRQKILDMGYTTQEITAALGTDLGAVTLAQVLRFIASKRREPRWDGTTFVYDGALRTPENVDDLDRRVTLAALRA